MNTTQLECFMAVADFLNFSRAAEHLRITQPAVSHQIRTLEDELGVELFQRTSKSVRLTQEGHLFLQYAGDILKLARQSATQVRQCRTSRPVRLGIGCRSAADLRLIRPALERLRREEPEVLPQLRLLPFSALDNLLADGDIEVMLTFHGAVPRKRGFQGAVSYSHHTLPPITPVFRSRCGLLLTKNKLSHLDLLSIYISIPRQLSL
ncbi:LysR family transcriptional regulator, partial [Intestinimonas massiliensis (ex Afouda et al. 2020)]|uniref:LysR family transcriptional regulator n=1 Tax=Intestinimonas massiliensis (ex Afouda et al. 2020) TaxID=1673721 RepID=UPI00103264BF